MIPDLAMLYLMAKRKSMKIGIAEPDSEKLTYPSDGEYKSNLIKEYELIKKKESKLPATQRHSIVRRVESNYKLIN